MTLFERVALESAKSTVESLFSLNSMPPNHYAVDIPEGDIAIMRQHPNIASLGDDAAIHQALWNISWRLYTEVHLSRERTTDKTSVNEAYTNWRDREVYFALAREGSDGSNGTFERIYRDVVTAVVTRAGEVFAEWGGSTWPHTVNSSKNLRASLQPYLDTPRINVDV